MAFCACEPEVEKPAGDGDFSISFSADTIFFDTLFTETQSITKRLKIYNNASGSITIDQIEIENKSSSPFSIYIKGEKGKSFNNINLLGKDSLLILVEAEINRQNEDLPFVVEDNLNVKHGKSYKLPLIAWGQDAIFLKDTILACNARFTNKTPYVLYGAVLVDSLCSLTIDPGARIYNHFNSTLYVKGSIKAEGTSDERIIFSNDRFDEDYINAAGQWGGIYLLEGTFDNTFLYTDIRNAQVGIRIGNPDDNGTFDLVVGQSRIENISTSGILAYSSDVYVYNSLIQNCALSSVAAVAGGTYRFWNNTFANYSYDFFREDASVIIADNVVLADNSLLVSDLDVDMKNNIIWGSIRDELVISDAEEAGVAIFSISNNIIRTSADTLGTANLINTDPEFVDPEKYLYQLDSASTAIDAGLFLPEISVDINGKERINAPDLGAFENQ